MKATDPNDWRTIGQVANGRALPKEIAGEIVGRTDGVLLFITS
jgi:hypothetical protein